VKEPLFELYPQVVAYKALFEVVQQDDVHKGEYVAPSITNYWDKIQQAKQSCDSEFKAMVDQGKYLISPSVSYKSIRG